MKSWLRSLCWSAARFAGVNAPSDATSSLLCFADPVMISFTYYQHQYDELDWFGKAIDPYLDIPIPDSNRINYPVMIVLKAIKASDLALEGGMT